MLQPNIIQYSDMVWFVMVCYDTRCDSHTADSMASLEPLATFDVRSAAALQARFAARFAAR